MEMSQQGDKNRKKKAYVNRIMTRSYQTGKTPIEKKKPSGHPFHTNEQSFNH